MVYVHNPPRELSIMDLFEQIDATLSAPWATPDEDLAYRMNSFKLSKVRKVRKVQKEKQPPSIALSHRLFKTGELKPEERLKRAFRNGHMSLSKMALLLAACKEAGSNDSSKIDYMANALDMDGGVIDKAFRVADVFGKAGEGWDPVKWLEF